jgi:transcriptional antiterminator
MLDITKSTIQDNNTTLHNTSHGQNSNFTSQILQIFEVVMHHNFQNIQINKKLKIFQHLPTLNRNSLHHCDLKQIPKIPEASKIYLIITYNFISRIPYAVLLTWMLDR